MPREIRDGLSALTKPHASQSLGVCLFKSGGLPGSRSSVTREAGSSAIPSRLSIPANTKAPPPDGSRPPSNRAHNS